MRNVRRDRNTIRISISNTAPLNIVSLIRLLNTSGTDTISRSINLQRIHGGLLSNLTHLKHVNSVRLMRLITLTGLNRHNLTLDDIPYSRHSISTTHSSTLNSLRTGTLDTAHSGHNLTHRIGYRSSVPLCVEYLLTKD